MAVEARHINLFNPQLVTNRDIGNSNEGTANLFRTQMGSAGIPVTGVLPDYVLPLHQSLLCDANPAMAASMKADSGLTYHHSSAPKKRPRDYSFDQLGNLTTALSSKANPSDFSPSVGEQISFQIRQQQHEIDCLIAEHTKKLRLEIEELQIQQARLLVSAVGEGIAKKLNEKDEQIRRIGRVNWVLQEKVKSLCAENRLLRDLAQTNEATANSLRSNLEQVMAHVAGGRVSGGGNGPAAEDAESCCESSHQGADRTAAGRAKRSYGGGCGGEIGIFKCRNCRESEACVLLLPCRHLCLCSICGSALFRTCPVCDSPTNATVHVNMS